MTEEVLKTAGKNIGSWSTLFYVVMGGFVAASVLASVATFFMMPKNNHKAPKSRAPKLSKDLLAGLDNQKVSLDDQEIKQILKRNIFNSEGGEEEVEAVAAIPVDDLVKTDLPLKLLGTIYAGQPEHGIALVENTSKQSVNSFMVGDLLTEGAVVTEILRERVIFERNGNFEYVEIEKKEIVRDRRKKKKGSSLARGNLGGKPTITSAPPPDTFKEEGFSRDRTSITMSQSYKQRLLTTDFTKVLQDAKATPNMVNGELRGFLLTKIRTDSIYEKSGLQNGDVIEEINGIPLTDTGQAIRLLNSLRSESEIEVRVSRGGSPINLNLRVQ